MAISPTHVDSTRWQAYRTAGNWVDQTTYGLFAAQARAHNDRLAIIDGDVSLRYDELLASVDSLAARLWSRHQVRPGDVVGYQLPNWWETAVVLLACSKLGAVVNPLHLVYRPGDLRYVIERTRPKVMFLTAAHSNLDAVESGRDMVRSADLSTTIVAARSGADDFGGLLQESPGDEVPIANDAGAVSLVLYTSGTTARPKGALHSENTLVRMVHDMMWVYDFTSDDVIFIPSSMTHVSGLSFVWSAFFTGCTAVLMSRWDATSAVELVRRTGATFVGGATPFVRGLVDGFRAVGAAPADVPFTRGNCGSADVPPDLIADADAVLGAPFSRGYGLTEGIIITVSKPADTLAHRGLTDGAVLPTNELRIVDESMVDLPRGREGEILVRGPSNFLGYLDPADNEGVFVDDSWIRTGDLGVLDEDGYLRITGRLKDLISRGGENISVKEVEDLLSRHPRVREVAIVGMPDRLLGERGCAFVVPTDTLRPPTLAELTDFLAAAGLAKFKWPERLEIREALPTTATGKIQKTTLRGEIRAIVSGSPHLVDSRDARP